MLFYIFSILTIIFDVKLFQIVDLMDLVFIFAFLILQYIVFLLDVYINRLYIAP